MTPAARAALRGLLAAATQGPWEEAEFRAGTQAPGVTECGVIVAASKRKKVDGTFDTVSVCHGMTGPSRDANARYLVALAPGVMGELLDAADERDRLVRELRLARKLLWCADHWAEPATLALITRDAMLAHVKAIGWQFSHRASWGGGDEWAEADRGDGMFHRDVIIPDDDAQGRTYRVHEFVKRLANQEPWTWKLVASLLPDAGPWCEREGGE